MLLSRFVAFQPFPRHSMGLPYMPTLTPQTTPGLVVSGFSACFLLTDLLFSLLTLGVPRWSVNARGSNSGLKRHAAISVDQRRAISVERTHRTCAIRWSWSKDPRCATRQSNAASKDPKRACQSAILRTHGGGLIGRIGTKISPSPQWEASSALEHLRRNGIPA